MLAPYEAGAPSRLRHLVISTLIALTLVSHTALTSLHAQTRYPIDDWADTGGTVELSKSMSATTGMSSLDLDLPSREGESVTYYLRLSKQPEDNGWWVRVHVNGVVYIDGVLEEKGILWVPSVGWEFNKEVNKDDSEATRWRSVTIYATEDSDADGEPINITHEVWDEQSNCPPSLHGIASVTARISDSDSGGGSGGDGDDGGGDGGGGDDGGGDDGDGGGDDDDDDDPPGLSIDDAPAVREGESAAFVVRLSASSGKVVTVAYETLDGTAVAGVDYTSTSGTLRFDAGETRTTLAVPTLEDATAEETEGFTVQLREPSGATVADGTATGTITDDDDPPGLSIDDAPAVREGESAAFVVRLSASSGKVVTVAYATMDGTAVAGADYTSTSGTLRFDAGETRQTLAVPTLEDATAEETEGFTVQLREPSGATVADGTATGTITDDDDPPGLSIDDAPAVREGESAAFVVRLSASSGKVVTVAYETLDGTAVAGVDYTSTSGTLRFDAGETRTTLAVPTLEDATAEETEGFTVQLREPSGATVADGTATGTITDDDDPPGLSIDDAPAVREGESAEFVVRLSAASGAAVTVAYETLDGTAVAGVDYTSTSGTLRFDAGETRTTLAVPTLEDATAEETEGFTVQLSEPSGATVADGTATGTITDDDERPGLSIDDAPAVREGETAEFVVRLSAASGVAVTVAYRTMDGTAVAGVDYTSTSGTLRFDAGETRTTLAVPTLEDATAEETEGFTVQLREPSGATVADGTATGTITDDDDPPGLSINDAPAVREGESAAFVVRLSASSGKVVTVAYATMDGTAVAGADYTSTSGTLRFDAGETRQILAVPTLEDATAEETEGFTVQLSDPSGATVADGTATGTITDDDDPPGLSIDDAPAVREGESAKFVVRLSAASGAAVTVAYETLDGTAVAGVDYTSTSGTLRFDAGETRTTLAVPTLEDATAEETEGFTVQLSDPSGATVADGTATGTITDDDDPPGLSIDDAPAVREGESAKFVVRLSAASGAAVTVAYETLDGTAVAGVDYTSTSGTLRFDAGETRTTLAVPTLEDATAEETEGFTVQLSEPSGATVADGTATGTITDDDERPGLSIDDAPAVREGETAEFVVRLSAASGVAVTVAYRTMDGTAVAGVDYTSTSGTLRFDAGETRQTLAVPTLEDATAEETEGFTVQLREPSGATVADGTATGTITDDVQQRIGVINDVVLPEVGRALAFSAVRCRIDQVLSGSAPRGKSTEPSARLALSPEARSGRWAAPGVQSSTLVQVFDDSLFLMQSQEEENGEGRFAAWWCPDYQNLGGGGRGGGITWDGGVSSWHAGVDARIGPDLLAGVSFSRLKGSFNYQGGGRNMDAGRGTYALGLVSIHPYLAWSVLPDLDVWGTVGHAWGDLRVVDAAAGNVLTSPAALDSGVVGVSGRLLTRGATTLRLKGEWALAQMNIARASTAFDAAAVDMQRLRMGAEVSYQHALSSGASLIPWGEVNLRHDGGDGEIGAGLELGGGLRHRNHEAGLTVEGHGRWLLIHRGTLREWGVGGLVRFAPKAVGRGPSVSLMPTWGDSASGAQQLWERGATDRHVHSAPGARLDAEFGYGFGALRDRGVLTPYVGLSLVGEAARGYRLGGRLAVGQSATVSLEAERRQHLAAARIHALLLLGTLQF